MQPFIVNLGALPVGTSHFEWKAEVGFFGIFGNPEITDANVDVLVTLHNHRVTVDAQCELRGVVTVPCDRCLEDLVIPVETEFEESYVTEGDELDLRQDVYDYICTALPFRKVHPDGECNEDTLKYLSRDGDSRGE